MEDVLTVYKASQFCNVSPKTIINWVESGHIKAYKLIVLRIALVAVTYSLLRAAPHDEVLLHKLQRQLEFNLEGSAASWRRTTQAQSLWMLACFITAAVTQGHSLQETMAPLLATICY